MARDIFSLFQTPFYYMDDPAVRKSFYDVDTYMRSEGEVTVLWLLIMTIVILSKLASDYFLSTAGAAAYYDKATL